MVRIEDRDGGSEGYTFDLFWGGYTQGGREGYSGGGGYPPPPSGGYGRGHGYNEQEAAQAVETCQRAASDRMRRDGFGRVEFNSTRMDDQPGRNDWVVGSARAYRGPNFDTFEFSCSVNLRSGEVRSVEVHRRR